jgi:hypothetical protein
MGRKSGKVSRLPPPFSQGFISEPGDHPHDIHRGGSEQLLEVRAREAEVATLAQIKAPDALREATLHARPQRILGFELGCLLPVACGLDRFVVGLGSDGELPGGVFRRGTHLTGGTGTTGSPVKADPKHRIA